MPLTEEQLKRLNDIINTTAISKIIDYIDQGLVTLDQLTNLEAQKRAIIEDTLKSRPNPVEQQEWADICNNTNESIDNRKVRLTNYINRWRETNPSGNHIKEAEQLLKDVYITIEATQWQAVDILNIEALYGYLEQFPHTAHLDEIDNMIWGCMTSYLTQQKALERYLLHFPSGQHANEANGIIALLAEWEEIRYSDDIFKVNKFKKDHENNSLSAEASTLLEKLKEAEFQKMHNNKVIYDISDRLHKLLQEEIITKKELIERNIVSNKTFQIIEKFNDEKNSLPPIDAELQHCSLNCEDDRTDVYFLGIPSTGKSCILMGLMGTPLLTIDTATGAGPYAAALNQYLNKGITIPRTTKNTVATINGEIIEHINNQDKKLTNKVNLIEMAGEDFAFNLNGTYDPDDNSVVVDFADMGEGVPELLCNKNRKVFFLIVDPTVLTVKVQREKTFIDENGQMRISGIQQAIVHQPTILSKMVSIFANPENAEIMKRVDALHIIVTKADVFGPRHIRTQAAYDFFQSQYGMVINKLINICQDYDINKATNGVPVLYPFSLGEFHLGGIFEYDRMDSDMLVRVIQANSVPEKNKTLWNKVQDFLNKPII